MDKYRHLRPARPTVAQGIESHQGKSIFSQRDEGARRRIKQEERVQERPFSPSFITDMTAHGAKFAPSALPDEFESHS